jgi:phosphoribosyl 1,2-cyclic phosphate phosphodiesterase
MKQKKGEKGVQPFPVRITKWTPSLKHMKLQYLGTAAAEGWPGLFCHCSTCERARETKGKDYRSRSQVIMNDDLLFDFGPDTFYHANTFDLDLAKIKTVLLTHSHTDHFYPTELILRAVPYAYDRDKNPMALYGNEKCKFMYEQMLEKEDDSANLRNCVNFNSIKAFTPFQVSGYSIHPLKAAHDPRENCLLYIVTDKNGKCIFYGNDTGIFSEETWNYIKDFHFDLVSLDCTMGPNPGCASHMGMEDNRLIKEKMLELGCADENTTFVMTHFSHNGSHLHSELIELASKIGFLVAYDGMVMEV